ncbi:MAG TPA: hypothetical protein VMG08_02820 [Allosphingosinicella sp.]|nr:hypothetical protein [Allosphingosinicella sp.]
MDVAAQIEADLRRVKRQLGEVHNPAMATQLRARAVILEHKLETLRAVARF